MDQEATRDLLRQCYQLALEHSDDPVTKNAAMIVTNGGDVVAWGVNRFPAGIEKSPERLQRPKKYDYLIHAEQDAIAAAAKAGQSTNGAVLVCPWAPCVDCARLIIQSGFSELVAHKQIHDRTPDRWDDSIKRAIGMLRDSGVAYRREDVEIGAVDSVFNGEVWQP